MVSRASVVASPAGFPLALGAALSLLALSGCKGAGGGVALAQEKLPDGPMTVPVPAEGGPRLWAVRTSAMVLDRAGPNGKVLGSVSPGASVARSDKPYGTAGCPGGWYAVRPRGFVCVGPSADGKTPEQATLSQPALALAPPDVSKALPYRYARTRTDAVPAFAGTPSIAAQLAAEPDVTKWLAKSAPDKEILGAAANDIPLDERGVPKGPPVLLPGREGVGAEGQRSSFSHLSFLTTATPPTLVDAPLATLRKGTIVAYAAAYSAAGPSGNRRFVTTLDSASVAADRLKPALGSTWHGIDLTKHGLPVAFVHKRGVHLWRIEKGKVEKLEDEVERQIAIPLTGKFRQLDGVRFEQSRDGEHLRAQDLITIVKRSKFPDFAKGSQKWIDVSVATQTLVLYEGTKPVYATLISTGRDMLKDPLTTASTPRGTFRIRRKAITGVADAREANADLPLADVPWRMELEDGLSLGGLVWADGVGEAHGFHDVSLTPIDAHRIFAWADPPLPEGWHSAAAASPEESTIVSIRP